MTTAERAFARLRPRLVSACPRSGSKAWVSTPLQADLRQPDGFQKIDGVPYCETLKELAADHQDGDEVEVRRFMQDMADLLTDVGREHWRSKSLGWNRKVEPSRGLRPLRALSIRQPHAEAIMRGVKKIEYRSAPTKIRGDIYIYASMGRYSADDEAKMLAEYGIDDVACDDLPRGVLVGTVELFDCDGGNWHVRNPVRLKKPPKPTKHPQPVWFNPF